MRSSDDDEEFHHNILCEGTKHPTSLEHDAPEDDGSQYLNDTRDGDAEQLEIAQEEVEAEVYGIRAYINQHFIYIYIQCVLIDIFPGIWIEEAKMKMGFEEKDEGAYQHH
jgi:hypothetical protein